jgi:hypothetical protein
MVVGREKKNFNLSFILPFYSDPSSGSHAPNHVTMADAGRGQTRSTRGGVLNITSLISFVISLVLSLLISNVYVT